MKRTKPPFDNRKEFEQHVVDQFLSEEPDPEFDICVYQTKPYTHAIFSFKYDCDVFTSDGYSKCNPNDEWDADLGAIIAVKRAARSMARMHKWWD